MRIRELESSIYRAINEHYGSNLVSFRDDLSHREGVEPLITSLVRIITESDEPASDLRAQARANGVDRLIWARFKSERVKRGVSAEEVARTMKVHPDFLSALESGAFVTLAPFLASFLRAIGTTKEEFGDLAKWVFSDLEPSVKNDGQVQDAAGFGHTVQSFSGVIDRLYGRNLWQFHPETGYLESIAPFIDSLVTITFNYRSTSRRMGSKPVMSRKLIALTERIKADADEHGVNWMARMAQQDEGMRDIFSRMIEAELAAVE